MQEGGVVWYHSKFCNYRGDIIDMKIILFDPQSMHQTDKDTYRIR